MKAFNTELNKDITRLKRLHVKKDKTDFNRLKAELMLKHGISKATVYREMKKDVPGVYKKPDYSPPQRAITEREIAMVRELLYKKIPVMNIPNIMESETGEKYNWDRIDNIRRIIDVRMNGESEPERGFESVFGGKLKRVVEEALNLDKMAPNAYVEIDVMGRKHKLSYGEARDIALVCMNSIERAKAGFSESVTYVSSKIWNLLEQKVSMAETARELSTKELIDLKKAYDDFQKAFDESFCKNFAVVWNVALELTDNKADYSHVYNLVQKYSALFPESTTASPRPLRREREATEKNGKAKNKKIHTNCTN